MSDEIAKIFAIGSVVTTYICAVAGVICGLWMTYAAYHGSGSWLIAAAAFVILCLVFKLGWPAVFAYAATTLAYYDHAVGKWLPVTSYFAAVYVYGFLAVAYLKSGRHKTQEQG
jgi:hypothetical protein